MIDLNFLNKKPILEKEVNFVVQPLAPLSMVNEIPGSYYKTEKTPTKFQICGLFENILGWHIGAKDREAIWKDLKKHYKKQYKEDIEKTFSNSGYLPLLYNHFEIEFSFIPQMRFFDDLWKKAFRRSDAVVHPNGTPNLDYSLLSEKRDLPRNEKKPMQPDDKSVEKLFKDNLGKFPLYYSTLAKREYVYLKENDSSDLTINLSAYNIKVRIDNNLLEALRIKLIQNSTGYLGTSDGWVEINIQEL